MIKNVDPFDGVTSNLEMRRRSVVRGNHCQNTIDQNPNDNQNMIIKIIINSDSVNGNQNSEETGKNQNKRVNKINIQ